MYILLAFGEIESFKFHSTSKQPIAMAILESTLLKPCSARPLSYENRDMAIAMSSSRADPVLGLNIPSSCPGWGYLNI